MPRRSPHPSLAVKIDNHEEARPQIALNRTDIVFEELVEGGLTRYVAIWHSDIPDEVGPVRSDPPDGSRHRRRRSAASSPTRAARSSSST